MKKLLCLSFIMILLCGCSSNTKKTAVKGGFTFKAEVTVNEKKIKINGSLDDEKNMTANVTSPKTIKGTYLFVNGDKISISYMGVSIDKSPEVIPASSFVKLIYDTIVYGDNGTQKVKGKTGEYSYTLYLSEDGLPEKLIVPKLKIEVVFSDITTKDR